MACIVTLGLEGKHTLVHCYRDETDKEIRTAHMIFWLKHNWRPIRSSGYIEELDLHFYLRLGFFTLYQTTVIV